MTWHVQGFPDPTGGFVWRAFSHYDLRDEVAVELHILTPDQFDSEEDALSFLAEQVESRNVPWLTASEYAPWTIDADAMRSSVEGAADLPPWFHGKQRANPNVARSFAFGLEPPSSPDDGSPRGLRAVNLESARAAGDKVSLSHVAGFHFFKHHPLAELEEALANASQPKLTKPVGREKQQKFGVLDAPNLLKSDLDSEPGVLGRVVIYFDLDNFKLINTRFSERVVDEYVLPVIQRSVAAAVSNHGYAYAEGGDEMVVVLQNATLEMGAAFADALRQALAETTIDVRGEPLAVTASFGVSAETDGHKAADAANLAKNFAKQNGKNCVAVSLDGRFELWQRSTAGSKP